MRPRFSLLNILIAVIGVALLIVTIRRVGWNEVVSGVTSVGWWFVLVVLLAAGHRQATETQRVVISQRLLAKRPSLPMPARSCSRDARFGFVNEWH